MRTLTYKADAHEASFLFFNCNLNSSSFQFNRFYIFDLTFLYLCRYGSEPFGKIPANQTLIFRVKLIGVV